MKRKGMWSLEFIGKMIIVLASFFIIAVFMYKLLTTLQEESPEHACRASVIAKMKIKETNIIGRKASEYFPVNCKTEDVDIPTERFRTGMSDYDKEQQLLGDIADMMAKCWWMFGNGYYENVFDDKAQNDNLCHVCYTFHVPNDLQDAETGERMIITPTELQDYLSTHKYDPGLLQGGDALSGGTRWFEITNQSKVTEQSQESRQLTTNRMLMSKKRLDNGVADFSGIFEEHPEKLSAMRTSLAQINDKYDLEIVYVITEALPEKALQDEDNVAFELLREWGIGAPTNTNGMAFIFDLYHGELLYASQMGADAILPAYYIDDLIGEKMEPLLKQQQPAEAIALLEAEIRKELDAMGEEKVTRLLNFQATYAAYLTGGAIASKVDPKKDQDTGRQGAVLIPASWYEDDPNNPLTTNGILAQERYAITYVSPKWGGGLKDLLGLSVEAPAMIGVIEYGELFTTGRTCNLNTDDG